MALVSSSVPISLPQAEMERNPVPGFVRSMIIRPPGGARSSLKDIEEEPTETPEDDVEDEEEEKVYVAIPKKAKQWKANLLWVLQNTAREKKIVLTNIHLPPKKIPVMGGWFPANQLQEEEVRAYRRTEMEKTNKSLDEYLELCAREKVQAEKLVIEMDDVCNGLVELISQHQITELVMGAAADRHYSRRMKVLRSRKAIFVQQQADPSCKLWFVCRGNLICMRQAGLGGSAISQPHLVDSLSSTSSQSEQLRSISLPDGQTKSLNMLTDPMEEAFPHRISTPQNRLTAEARADKDSGDESSRSPHGSERASDEVPRGIGSSPLPKDQEPEERPLILSSVNKFDEELQHSPMQHELDDAGTDDDTYEKLQLTIVEAENLQSEAYEESRRRQKAERDLYEVKQKVKASESSHSKEMKQRKEIEERLAREKAAVEELRRQRNKILEEVQKAHDRRATLELQVIDYEHVVKGFEEKLSAAHLLLTSLRREHKDLQGNRESEATEAEEVSTGAHGSLTFSAFSYSELQQATLNFDDSVKIGEGSNGTVYKGFLHQTTMAIKMLNPQSMLGKSEFHQKVAVFSRLRHPNLVNVIGACPEARALVYEFLPNGSLEDRLNCKDNAPPLTWQTRIRIAAEICTALDFLHSNTVVHGDLKPTNVLLDSNFVSKLSDFGICHPLAQSNTTTNFYHLTYPEGTFVYMDPEFLVSGERMPQSDVYSFGVILLCLLTGRPSLRIIKEVKEAMEKHRLHEILDASAGSWPFLQTQQLVHLALRCCEIERRSRPDLAGEVWRVLEPMMKAALSVGPSSSSRSASEDGSSTPSYFICPISQEIMRDPHIAGDGFTYEGEAIKGWLDGGHETSPITNLKLPHPELIPNHALRSAIQEWLQTRE